MGETAPVRAGEELDVDALRRHLTGVIDGAEHGIEVAQFPGGHSNLTYLLRIGERRLVLRRAPLGPVAPKAHDMAREHAVLQRLAPRYAPAPRPLHLCEDTSVIGAVFYLMERREGAILRDVVPEAHVAAGDHGRRISRTLVDGLVDLHRIDIFDSGLVAMGRPAGFLERQVEGWAARWARARTGDLPQIERTIAYLRDTVPAALPPTVVHNDYKLDNVMLDPVDPDRLVAVLDWEMATVGDPLVDVGLSLVYWQQLSTPPDGRTELGAPGAATGWYTREQFVRRYAERSGRDLRGIGWYEVLGIFKLAVILQQIHHRYVRGQTADERFAHLDRRITLLAGAAQDRIP
jgi:aminoglycoside phosphotransferase (APT) family kinase protein